MLRKIFYSLGLLLVLLSGCKETPKVSLLDEVSGVWKPQGEDGLMMLSNEGGKLKFVADAVLVPVSLGGIDTEQETINLTVPGKDGAPMVWTLRRIWDKEHKSFHLSLTLHDGKQADLSFVRKLTKEDLDRIAKLQASPQKTAPAAAPPAELPPAGGDVEAEDHPVLTAEEIEESKNIETKAGVLKFKEDEGGIYGNLTFNDKVLLETVLPLQVDARYPFGDKEVLVLNVGTGGNGPCPIDYYFLTANSNGSVTLSPSIGCHGEAELKTEVIGNRIHATIDSTGKPDKYEYDYEKDILLANGKVQSR